MQGRTSSGPEVRNFGLWPLYTGCKTIKQHENVKFGWENGKVFTGHSEALGSPPTKEETDRQSFASS